MKKLEIAIVHNYNPFDKTHPFFFEIYENGLLLNSGNGTFKGIGLVNLLLEASSISLGFIGDFKEGYIHIFVQEEDFHVYKINKFIDEVRSLNDYVSCEELGRFVDRSEGLNISFVSSEKNFTYEKILKNIFNRHFSVV